MTMSGPDVLGIPAPSGVITALSVAANTIVATSIILAVGLGTLLIAMRIYRKHLEFLSGFQRTINSAFLPTLTIAITGIFLSLLMEYMTPGHSFFFRESILTYIARIIFLAGVSLAVGAAFLTIANHVRAGDERVAIFGLRIVCGAVFAASCARIAHIWLIAEHHPANPQLAGIIIVGTLIATATIGTAILGILRPRLPLWSISTATFLFIGIAASCYASVHLADEAYRTAAPTFDAAHRMQPALMILFFGFTACAIAVIGLMLRWWMEDVKSEAQAKPNKSTNTP